MEFTEYSLETVAVWLAKDKLRPIPLIATTKNESVPSEKCEACTRGAGRLSYCGKSLYSHLVTKCELYIFLPSLRRGLRSFIIRRYKYFRCFVSHNFAVEREFKEPVSDEHSVNTREVLLNFFNGVTLRGLI